MKHRKTAFIVFVIALIVFILWRRSWALSDSTQKNETKVQAAKVQSSKEKSGVLLSKGRPEILMWSTLQLKESKKVEDQKKLKSIVGTLYRIPGFMIPLETAKDTTKEFLLVPSLPACAHVPPPPPSQTVHVKMNPGSRAKIAWDPIWVEGTVVVKEGQQSGYGEASFEMKGQSVKLIQQEEINEINKLMPPSTYVPDCNGRDKYDPACMGGGKKGQSPQT